MTTGDAAREHPRADADNKVLSPSGIGNYRLRVCLSRPTKYNRLYPGFIAAAALASTLALYYGTGPQVIWWHTWSPPLPLLLIASPLSPGAAFAVSFFAAAAGALNLWRYFRQSLESPLITSLRDIEGGRSAAPWTCRRS